MFFCRAIAVKVLLTLFHEAATLLFLLIIAYLARAFRSYPFAVFRKAATFTILTACRVMRRGMLLLFG